MARLGRRNDGGARSGPGTVHPVSEQPYELISTPDGLVAQIAVRGQRRAAYLDRRPRHALHRGRARAARPRWACKRHGDKGYDLLGFMLLGFMLPPTR
jgi:hypothetical protein